MVRMIALIASLLALTGCASGPPVQEMSDARQAIAAARTAGASETTSPDLYAAQAAIARAESHLQAQEYVRARYAALAAKHHAAAALTEAQQAESAHPKSP
jgi:outer membrane murein-binding lipoprotein Lpp